MSNKLPESLATPQVFMNLPIIEAMKEVAKAEGDVFKIQVGGTMEHPVAAVVILLGPDTGNYLRAIRTMEQMLDPSGYENRTQIG